MIVLEPPQGQVSELVDKLKILCGNKRPGEICRQQQLGTKLKRWINCRVKFKCRALSWKATSKAYEAGLSFYRQPAPRQVKPVQKVGAFGRREAKR